MKWRIWTQLELEILRRDYAALGPVRLAGLLGRTRDAVIVKAGDLGLTVPNEVRRERRGPSDPTAEEIRERCEAERARRGPEAVRRPRWRVPRGKVYMQ